MIDGLLCNVKTLKYKSLSQVKEDAEYTSTIVEEVLARYNHIQEEEEEAKQTEYTLKERQPSARKSAPHPDAKKMIEFDKPTCAPFNYDYYDPITGDTNTLFIDESTQSSTTTGFKRRTTIQQYNRLRNQNRGEGEEEGNEENEGECSHNTIPCLDLFGMRWMQELESRLGEECLLDQQQDQYYNALFMSLWNRLNIQLNATEKVITNVGAKIRAMIQLWARHYNHQTAQVINFANV